MPDDFSAAQALPKKLYSMFVEGFFCLFVYSSAGCPKQLFYIQIAAAFLNTLGSPAFLQPLWAGFVGAFLLPQTQHAAPLDATELL